MYWIRLSSASSCGEARVPRTVLITAAATSLKVCARPAAAIEDARHAAMLQHPQVDGNRVVDMDKIAPHARRSP